MNGNQVKGNWKQFKGKVKEQWGKLTDEQLDVINGKLEEAYGICKDEAARQISAFESRCAAWKPVSKDQGATQSERTERSPS